MKKFVAFALMLALCGFAWGCGGGEKKKTPEKPPQTQPEKKPAEGEGAK